MMRCPQCNEEDDLTGLTSAGGITVTCGACGFTWERSTDTVCNRCGLADMFEAVAAIIEKGRGTQLSVVGSRVVHLCETCDRETIRRYLDTRPNPLMPDHLPNAPGDES